MRRPSVAAPEGYLHPTYVASLAESGTPLQLHACGGWLLVRDIPGTAHRDAMGPYPLFCCQNWESLGADLRELENELVSVTVVTNPVGDYREEDLRAAFDHVVPFKQHFLVDTAAPLEDTVSTSHRRLARRALKDVRVEVCERPLDFLDQWMTLYAALGERHGITGLRAFSRQAFAAQLSVPGMTMFRATHHGELVGLDLWYLQREVAQGHLVAFSERGYELRASYATKWTLLQYFSDKARLINLGGLAGTAGGDDSGLAHFKRGWSNTTRTAFLCGRVLNAEVYGSLVKRAPAADYFPAYRAGEFD